MDDEGEEGYEFDGYSSSSSPFMSNRYQSHDWPSLILDNSRLLASPSIIGGVIIRESRAAWKTAGRE